MHFPTTTNNNKNSSRICGGSGQADSTVAMTAGGQKWPDLEEGPGRTALAGITNCLENWNMGKDQ